MDWLDFPPVQMEGVILNQVLTLTDMATKMLHLLTTSDTVIALKTAKIIVSDIVRYHGLLTTIVSDRTSALTSHGWTCLCERMNIKHRFTSPFHPQDDTRP